MPRAGVRRVYPYYGCSFDPRKTRAITRQPSSAGTFLYTVYYTQYDDNCADKSPSKTVSFCRHRFRRTCPYAFATLPLSPMPPHTLFPSKEGGEVVEPPKVTPRQQASTIPLFFYGTNIWLYLVVWTQKREVFASIKIRSSSVSYTTEISGV